MIQQISVFHDLGYVHRDVKLENFRIDSKGDVWLIDFGSTTLFNMEKRGLK